MSFSFFTASLDSFRITSSSFNNPLIFLFIATKIIVPLLLKSFSASFTQESILIDCSFIKEIFPAATSEPFTLPRIPLPIVLIRSSLSNNWIFLFCAASTMLSAKGCSDFFSSDAAYFNSSSSDISFVLIRVSTGLPSVKVPVLSKMIVEILCAVSKLSPSFIKMPS